ncbi:hypothetical protein OSB04_017314 [Centaurea solstitialis]|uniref:F-box associated beta-propeller type 3 domain-containing protein n=1 Tax=Centaurea solstitialis TaxID=347529 RepID=A0AA38T4A5_9ASTR|nr:hypothetical protein OSB04_017314 [Centaurea solstitialis]
MLSYLNPHSSNPTEEDEVVLNLISGFCYHSVSVTAHLSRSPHLELPDFIEFPDSPLSGSLTFFGSINGLICYAFRTDRDRQDDYVIQIWNPSLSAVLTLPPFNGLDWVLIGDDATCQLHFRFGYDPETDDYKLLKLMSYSISPDPIDYPPGITPDVIQAKWYFNNSINDVKEVEVYSMRNVSWKLLQNRLPPHVREIVDEQVVCADGHDGRLHWIGSSVNENEQTIVTFDLGMETFGEIPLPLPISVIDDSQLRHDGLGFNSGKLCFMSFKKGYDYEIWVMNEYGVAESWTKLHIFSHFSGDIDPYGFTSSNKFLFKTFSDDMEYYDYAMAFGDHLEFYDPGDEKVKSFKMETRDRIFTKIVRLLSLHFHFAGMDSNEMDFQEGFGFQIPCSFCGDLNSAAD